MKKARSFLLNLLLFSTLLWAVPPVEAEEMTSGIPTDMTAYCNPEFPTVPDDGLSWQSPVLDPLTATIVDFYSSCDYGPPGSEEVSFPPLNRRFSRIIEKNKPGRAIFGNLEAANHVGLRTKKTFNKRNIWGL